MSEFAEWQQHFASSFVTAAAATRNLQMAVGPRGSAIGNPKEKIRIEPMESPVPEKTPAPAPVEVPEKVPA